jgi:hypothetical protein
MLYSADCFFVGFGSSDMPGKNMIGGDGRSQGTELFSPNIETNHSITTTVTYNISKSFLYFDILGDLQRALGGEFGTTIQPGITRY